MLKLNQPCKIPEIPTPFLTAYFDLYVSIGKNARILLYVQSLEKYSFVVDKIKTKKKGKSSS